MLLKLGLSEVFIRHIMFNFSKLLMLKKFKPGATVITQWEVFAVYSAGPG